MPIHLLSSRPIGVMDSGVGGIKAAAYCHLARTVCRRAERKLVTLARDEKVTEISLKYLNRLSDLLFVLCRIINKAAGVPDVLWQNNTKAKNKTA